MDVIAGCSVRVRPGHRSQFVDRGAAETPWWSAPRRSRGSATTRPRHCIRSGRAGRCAAQGRAGVRAFSLGADGARSRLLMTPAAVAVPGQQPPRDRAAALPRHGGPRDLQGRGDRDGRIQPRGDRRSGLSRTTSTCRPPPGQPADPEAPPALKTPMANVVMNVARYGNTSAARSPSPWPSLGAGQIRPGSVLLTAFGAGWPGARRWSTGPPHPASRAEEPTRRHADRARLLDGTCWTRGHAAPCGPRSRRRRVSGWRGGQRCHGPRGDRAGVRGALAGQGARGRGRYGSDGRGRMNGDLVKAAGPSRCSPRPT